MKINLINQLITQFVVILLAVLAMISGLEIRVPINYTALAADLEIHVQDLPSTNTVYYLQLLAYYRADNSKTIIGSTPLSFDYNSSVSSENSIIWIAKFPCGLITEGGRYAVRIQLNAKKTDNLISNNNYNEVTSNDEDATDQVMESVTFIQDNQQILSREPENTDHLIKNYISDLDVRWPSASLSFEVNEIQTYPDKSVIATIMFQSTYCEPAIGSLVPETWLTLVYCGKSVIECKPDNKSNSSQVLYSEQIRGYPTLRYIPLDCQYFGQDGYYALLLTSGMHGNGKLISMTGDNFTLKAVWSEKFVFNVHARSIFRCDVHSGGVAVLFQYPECILNNDRVRLFGRLRADVASLLPPTTLEYITEQKVFKGKHNLHFDCDLFSEKYVEYCFVYVSQAITGAVSDVREDCIPTFPITEKDAGRWGRWSEWSPCSTSCKGGTRNRYRFCDSPPPRYGAKFCEGHALETETCGNDTSWECQLYNGLSADILTIQQDIKDEVGPGCQCGCVVHLASTNPKRLLAASTKVCSKKALWLIQAEPDYLVQVHIDQIRLPCLTQKLKIHDGEFVSSNLLAQYLSSDTVISNFSVISSTQFLLLELISGEAIIDEQECIGGFLCHLQQIAVASNASHVSLYYYDYYRQIPLEAVHIAIALILFIVFIMSVCLIIQYADKYYEYQKANTQDDNADTDISESCSRSHTAIIMSHETSMSTLVEEAIPMYRIDETSRNSALIIRQSRNSSKSRSSLHSNEEENSEYKNKRDSAVQTSCFDISGLYTEKTNNLYREDDSSAIIYNNENRKNKLNLASFSTPEEPLSVISPTLKTIEILKRRPSEDTQASNASSICSTISSKTASLKGSTLKRIKDLQNREKMVAGSDFSLTGQDTDLEIDYYDYNVNNTNEVPGSYLGMDPLYCVWIPPFAPGQWVTDEQQGSAEEQSVTSASSTENIEMKVFHRPDNRRKSGQYSQQHESALYEKYKRFSNISSSSNKTLMPDVENRKITPDENLIIKDPIIPDAPMKVQTAFVVKEKEPKDKKIMCTSFDALDAENLKYADDESEEEDEKQYSEIVENDNIKTEKLWKENQCIKIENAAQKQVRYYKETF